MANIATLTLGNNTCAGNSAQSAQGAGGGILNQSGTADITNSTFSANSAGLAGGIFNGSGTLMLRNTIVSNSTSSQNCFNDSGTLTADAHNLADDSTCGNATVSSTINLGPLSNNGGATQTMALQAGSSAIDAGDDVVCAAPPIDNLDQRGVTRPQGTHCDIGAFELQQTTPPGTMTATASNTPTSTSTNTPNSSPTNTPSPTDTPTSTPTNTAT